MKQKATILLFVLGCILVLTPLVHAQASKLNRSVRTADNMEPAIPRPEQDKAVAAKLAALEKKTGKKPNIVWLLIDDMGFGDPGSYGGGKAIGADTPHMDRLARGRAAPHVVLFAEHLHAHALRDADRPPSRAHGPHATHPRRGQAHRESVGGRNQPAEDSRRIRLQHAARRQMAHRRGQGHAPARGGF